MREAVLRNVDAGLDGMLFLGDGLASAWEVARSYGLELYAVTGNCDAGVSVADRSTYEKLIELGGKKLLLIHGHRYGGDSAVRLARSKGADLLMCGHTHRREDFYLSDEPPLRVFNPGSISLPRDGGSPSFGLMEIRYGCLYLSHGEI